MLVLKMPKDRNEKTGVVPFMLDDTSKNETTKRYFIRTNLYKNLTENGYLERAVANSEKLCQLCKKSPEDLKAYSEIHKVIELLSEL